MQRKEWVKTYQFSELAQRWQVDQFNSHKLTLANSRRCATEWWRDKHYELYPRDGNLELEFLSILVNKTVYKNRAGWFLEFSMEPTVFTGN